MTENQHPAAEIINPHHDPRPWQDCTREDIRQGDLVEALIRGLTTRIGVAHRQDENGDWYKKDGCPLTNGDRWPLRRIPARTTEKETTMTENQYPLTEITAADQGWQEAEKRRTDIAESDAATLHERCERIREERDVFFRQCEYALDRAEKAEAALAAIPTPAEPLARTLLGVPEGHGAPHHDGDRIKAGDYVLQVYESGTIRAGRVHYQDPDGNWRAESGRLITNASRRADRPDAITVWPAPTPPAEEVEWEPQFGDIITGIRYGAEGQLDRLVNAGAVVWADETGHFWYLTDFTAFTLPDGTRARRDGEREDGTPRFIKVAQEEA